MDCVVDEYVFKMCEAPKFNPMYLTDLARTAHVKKNKALKDSVLDGFNSLSEEQIKKSGVNIIAVYW